MSLVNIISAIGNNSSIYPLIVRDCGIEVPTKIAMTYNQNKEDKRIAWLGARERFIDEYSVSAVWLGGIPLIDKIGKSAIKRVKKLGLNADVNMKLFNKDPLQNIDKNIKDFAQKAPDAVQDLINVKQNSKLFKTLMNTKFIASIAVPIALMGFVIPKLIFASTAKKMEKYKNENEQMKNLSFGSKDFEQFLKPRKANMTSFQGGLTSFITNLTTVQKMAVTDGGYAAGRIITARKKNEAIDLAFKFSGMMFLNFVAPHWIEKAFNLITDVNLDPKMLVNKRFLASIKNNNLVLPKSNSAKDLTEFIDNNPKALFTQLVGKYGKVKLLENGVRDPRAYVDVKELAKFKNNIEKFAKNAKAAGMKPKAAGLKGQNLDIIKFANKSLRLRSLTILANIGLSSFLLAYCLPKAQFLFREWYTGSKLEPGLIEPENVQAAEQAAEQEEVTPAETVENSAEPAEILLVDEEILNESQAV